MTANIGKLAGSFSWRLALIFIVIGVLGALVAEFLVSDYDERGVIESHDRLRLVFETQGKGPPLITLAGGPGISHHGFHPYLSELRHVATVVYFDPRGRGDSEIASSYSVADDVLDLESLRSGLNLQQVDLLGVSYGAHLAVAYGLEYPQRVRKLVLVSPLVGRTAWEAHLQILLNAPGMAATFEHIRARRGEVLLSELETSDEIVRTLLPLYWCDPVDARRQSSPFRHRHRIARQNFEVYEAIVGRPFGELNGDLAGSDIETRLGELGVPTLLIQGECDRIIPEEHVTWLAGRLPSARVVSFPDAGHSPFVDNRRRFVEEVGKFLTEP